MGEPIHENAMLILDPPDELIIEGPLSGAVSKQIVVYNPSDSVHVAFKLKTTTPRLFFVRPNVGLIKPDETVKIDIFVHPLYQDSNMKRHKFLMQGAVAPKDLINFNMFWKEKNKLGIWESKIKVKMVEAKVESLQNIENTNAFINASLEEHCDFNALQLQKQVNDLNEECRLLKDQVVVIKKEKEEEITKIKQSNKCSYLFLMVQIFILFFAFAVGYMANTML